MSLGVRLTEVGAGIARIDWEVPVPDAVDDEALRRRLTQVADGALGPGGMRRLEIVVPATHRLVRRAVLRSGFRLEGVRRAVVVTGDGGLDDLVLYARLVGDVVGGPDVCQREKAS